MDVLHNLPQLVTAVGGLGTAAFGLVDATKVLWGGVNHVGFRRIANRVSSLTPNGEQSANAVSQKELIQTLKGNWFNGTDLNSQKSIAKSLIKLHLNSSKAAATAKATNLDPKAFESVIDKQSNGQSLEAQEGDLYARFDLIVTAMLDETYQMADQDYRNATRALAVLFSIGLSLVAWLSLQKDGALVHVSLWDALIIGVLATPLAPIAKDLSSALATAVNTLQAVKN